jgi:pSer/pThr/pTyr-binding forkhead associated (FHA) protein
MGRSRSCTLRLPGDATVSRQHCLLELDADGVWIQDLGSLNGTFVNGEKIGQREARYDGDATMVQPGRQCLRDGDLLRICNNVFAVQVLAQAGATLPEDSEFEMALCI